MRAFTYVYILKTPLEPVWEQRARDIVKTHGRFKIVDNPQEAELFITSTRSDWTKVTRSRGEAELGGVSSTFNKGASLSVVWFKNDPDNPENVEARWVFTDSRGGSKALEKTFARFFAAIGEPMTKGRERKPSK